MRIKTVALIILTTLFIGWLIILPVSAGEYNNLNANVYDWLNGQGNPGKELPKDGVMFHAQVTYVYRIYEIVDGERTGKYWEQVRPVGYYDFSQVFPNAYTLLFGMPYSSQPYESCWLFWCWEEEVESFYHIQPVNTPPGYCPMYPNGEDYHKGDTTTTVLKYYRSDECGIPQVTPYHTGGMIVIR